MLDICSTRETTGKGSPGGNLTEGHEWRRFEKAGGKAAVFITLNLAVKGEEGGRGEVLGKVGKVLHHISSWGGGSKEQGYTWCDRGRKG